MGNHPQMTLWLLNHGDLPREEVLYPVASLVVSGFHFFSINYQHMDIGSLVLPFQRHIGMTIRLVIVGLYPSLNCISVQKQLPGKVQWFI
jgi:hypothetical protein